MEYMQAKNQINSAAVAILNKFDFMVMKWVKNHLDEWDCSMASIIKFNHRKRSKLFKMEIFDG